MNMKTSQLPDQFVICSSQHTAAPDNSYVYFLSNGGEQNLITLRYYLIFIKVRYVELDI